MSHRDQRQRFCALLIGVLVFRFACLGPADAQEDSRRQSDAGTFRLVGLVVAEETGLPIMARVTARTPDDSTVVVARIADNGMLDITGIPQGAYRLAIEAPERRRVERDIRGETGPAVDIGTVRLTIQAIELAGLEVHARPEPIVFEVGRTLYHTKDLPVAGNANDLLRSIPELTVSPDGAIGLQDGTPVAIHINNRLRPSSRAALVAYLQQLPADRIERVEVDRNPSAKHEADGPGGIVNLVMRANENAGVSGSASTMISSVGSYNAAGGLGYQAGRLSMIGDVSVVGTRSRMLATNTRANYLTQPQTTLYQTTRSRSLG